MSDPVVDLMHANGVGVRGAGALGVWGLGRGLRRGLPVIPWLR